MTGFDKVSERLIHQGYVIGVYQATFSSPEGEEMVRDVVRHPGAVSVVPVLDDGDVVMVRQFRAPLEDTILEIPAGKRDVDGEPPVETARREFAEEIGFLAADMEPLVALRHSPGFCDEINHIFLATGLTPTDRQVDGPEEEAMTIHHVPLGEVFERIARGEITDAKSIAGLTITAQRMGVVPAP